MPRTLKILAALLGLGVAAVLVVLLAVRLAEQLGEADEGGPLTARVEESFTGELTQTFVTTGTVRAVRDVQISARVSARIESLPHKEGNDVEAGDLLVKLDASELEAELAEAENQRDARRASLEVERAQLDVLRADRAVAEQRLAQTERERARQQRLADTGDVAASLLEAAELAAAEGRAALDTLDARIAAAERGLEVAGFNIAAAESQIRRVQEQLADTEIRSPIDGTVTALNVEEGEVAVTGTMNNPGTVLLTVADLSALHVVTRIEESDVAAVRPGQPATVRMPAFGERTFRGEVERVALSTDAGSGSAGSGEGGDASTFEARIRLIDTLPQARTGLTAEAEIVAEQFTGVVLVPSQAVLGLAVSDLPEDTVVPPPPEAAGGNAEAAAAPAVRSDIVLVVYVAEGATARATPVRIGPADGRHTVVTAGLDAGAPVVTGPFDTLTALEPGAAITVEAEADGDAPPAGPRP